LIPLYEPRENAMRIEAMNRDEFEADFALTGAMELEETDESDDELELELLAVRVRAARYAGA
jgi:hypothetical protein